ncbi:hypothetical protein SAMN05660337_2008 [Maridesulfovibrio ferrireducens]|uniref:Uncharacterized protein n=1 Tax=Maridesulfovibrio ferrireducens TaxID=246191 RepID=A0A1G9H553_9BACT|nr:hypothetical protein [Maridesulfovibrio ferrireducens]SDL07969.1 hypothetical protein SAMN05660337_2008 [Maridesulfovibrio ferrireducens]
MSNIKHKVEQQPGVSVHREIPAMRSAEEFDVSQMSVESRAAWKRVCGDGNATADDFKHVFSSIMSSRVVEDVLK